MVKPYKPACEPYACCPEPATRKGQRWTCKHGRTFVLCCDGGWEPLLTNAETVAMRPEMEARTARVDAFITRWRQTHP